MPTYEYRCPRGHEFEQFVLRISEAAATLACPTCGEPAARRISAGGGLLFKGSGFYITDYGKDGKKAERAKVAKSSGDAPKAASGDAAKTGEAKPAGEAKPTAAGSGTGGTTGSSGPSKA